MLVTDRARGDLLILLAAFIWGVAFYFQKIAMLDIGPLLFLGMRGAVAALTLLPFAMVEQQRLRRAVTLQLSADVERKSATGRTDEGSIVPFGLLAGVIFFLAAATQQSGIVTATVTNTGFLTALYVVVTPFLFWIVRRQKPGRITWLSVAFAMVGVWALSGGSLDALSHGDILIACSSVFWASLLIVSGESARYAKPLSYTCIQFFIVAALGLCAAGVVEVIEFSQLAAALIPILYVGVLSSAFTFGIMAIALQHVAAPRASVLLSMETVFAAMAGAALLGERLTWFSWSGAALILLAVFVVKLDRAR
jgi:drug/metabolite transporter (DMT)-like permease